ncbi:MAG TPA: hypothetical protein VFM49_20545 [Chloroflexia bacterium]|nr:hypothetical protein [Chloroflexia bacterium]
MRPESRAVTGAGQDIIAVSRRSLDRLAEWIAGLQGDLTPEEVACAPASTTGALLRPLPA